MSVRLQEQALAAQLALKDRALDVAAEGITIADARLPSRPLIYANDGFERLTGYPVGEVLGRNCRFLQGPDTDPAAVAEIRAAERVPKSNKLIKMSVSTGDEERTIVAGIGTRYAPEELVGRKVVIVANLQPAKLMGVESNGMVLAASIDGEPSLVSVDPSVPPGTKVR